MYTAECQLTKEQLNKLLCAASPDAALVYLYIRSGNDPASGMQELHIPQPRWDTACATLRQLGLWPEETPRFIPTGERPAYSEKDVLSALDGDNQFVALYGEVQRLLGRTLNTEELKILLGFVNYLGLPPEVITVLVCYCKDRARQKGSLRNPSLRTVEKEAYHWAEQGIDTLEAAAAFIQNQNQKNSRLSQLMALLQIRGRNLTPGEERYALSWLDMGFSKDAILMAYERTCLNTGGMNWAYMNKILVRWHQAGLHTAQEVQSGDTKKETRQAGPRQLDADELAAIARMMQEDT